MLENARQIDKTLQDEFSEFRFAEHAEVRHCGTMLGIELFQDARTRTSFPVERRIGHQVTLACRRLGVILRNIGDVVVVYPAPGMPLELVRSLCRAVKSALAEVLA